MVQFLLFDISATLVFLLAYLATLAVQRRLAPRTQAGRGSAAGASGGTVLPGVAPLQRAEVAFRS